METLEYTMWELGIDNIFSAFRHSPHIAWMFSISILFHSVSITCNSAGTIF